MGMTLGFPCAKCKLNCAPTNYYCPPIYGLESMAGDLYSLPNGDVANYGFPSYSPSNLFYTSGAGGTIFKSGARVIITQGSPVSDLPKLFGRIPINEAAIKKETFKARVYFAVGGSGVDTAGYVRLPYGLIATFRNRLSVNTYNINGVASGNWASGDELKLEVIRTFLADQLEPETVQFITTFQGTELFNSTVPSINAAGALLEPCVGRIEAGIYEPPAFNPLIVPPGDFQAEFEYEMEFDPRADMPHTWAIEPNAAPFLTIGAGDVIEFDNNTNDPVGFPYNSGPITAQQATTTVAGLTVGEAYEVELQVFDWLPNSGFPVNRLSATVTDCEGLAKRGVSLPAIDDGPERKSRFAFMAKKTTRDLKLLIYAESGESLRAAKIKTVCRKIRNA